VRFFAPRCPVTDDERTWTDDSMRWFLDRFGRLALHRRVVLPTPDFFPGAYSGTEAQVRAVVTRICGYLDLDPARIVVEFVADADAATVRLLESLPAARYQHTGAAGHYQQRDGKGLISITDAPTVAPMALVATIAHELCHELLIGGGLVTPSRKDNEPLTDLLTVFLGFGVFTANAAFEFTARTRGPRYGWQASRLGYLTEPMYGYALARYATMRGESAPAWAAYLDTNPRVYLKKGLRYLRAQPG
jgi:hypothetical protein